MSHQSFFKNIVESIALNAARNIQNSPHVIQKLKDLRVLFSFCMSKVKIVDENGRVVPVNTRGELWTRGYSTMLKYWNDEDKTAQTITAERWLKTG